MEKKDMIIVEGYVEKVTPLEEEFVPVNPLNRPPMHYTKPIIALLLYLALFAGILFVPFGKWWLTLIALSVYSVIYFSCIAKKAIIWMVHLYQNLASDETRTRCVFEPSCSEYMILAVQKYGVIKGVWKGINRLRRCGHERGIDYP